MAIAKSGTIVSAQQKSATATWASIPVLSNDGTVGRSAVATVAVDNYVSTVGAQDSTIVASITDSAGNTWLPVRERSSSSNVGGAATCKQFYCAAITSPITTSTTFQVNFSGTHANAPAMVLTVDVFSVPIELVDFTFGDAANAAAVQLTVGSLPSKEYLAYRSGAWEGANQAITPTTSWTVASVNGTSGGTAGNNMCAKNEYRVQTATSFTSEPAQGSADHAGILGIFAEAEEEPTDLVLVWDSGAADADGKPWTLVEETGAAVLAWHGGGGEASGDEWVIPAAATLTWDPSEPTIHGGDTWRISSGALTLVWTDDGGIADGHGWALTRPGVLAWESGGVEAYGDTWTLVEALRVLLWHSGGSDGDGAAWLLRKALHALAWHSGGAEAGGALWTLVEGGALTCQGTETTAAGGEWTLTAGGKLTWDGGGGHADGTDWRVPSADVAHWLGAVVVAGGHDWTIPTGTALTWDAGGAQAGGELWTLVAPALVWQGGGGEAGAAAWTVTYGPVQFIYAAGFGHPRTVGGTGSPRTLEGLGHTR